MRLSYLLRLLPAACLGLAFFEAGAAEAAGPRQVLNFNRDWRFILDDVKGAEAPDFSDASWSAVGLPHSFSLPYFAANTKFYVGYGWYRKHFEIPAASADRRLFLEFEAAFQDAEVFVNGTPVGRHRGGYTGFSLDITAAAKPGDNVVAVRLNNLWDARLAPRAGEHVFSGGIYRNVWLVSTAPLHVAWYGTFVTTPKLSAAAGTVNVKTEIINQGLAPKSCGLRTEVLDPSGQVVASMSSLQTITAGQTVTFDQTSATIPNPQLWSPETPTLYRVVSTVFDGQKPADRFETPFGFRWIEWTADRGFFLNGKHRYFKGANVHQDHAGWGDAVTGAGAARDVKMIKDAGFDFIRGSHYPHAPAFADACDRLGMLFWSENCFWGTGGFKGDGYWNCSAYPVKSEDEKPFEESVKASLRDMIRIHRNHPSIIVWSMSNEPFFSEKSVMPKVREFLKQLVAYSHELDPTRPAAIGGAQRGDIDKLGDVAGQNGDGARLFINTGVPSVVSEYSSISADRPGNYAPGWGDLLTAPGVDKNKPYSWRFPWRSGESIWCGFDHGSIAGRKFGAMGLIDYFRLPKRAWYWYRNEYAKIPPPEWPRQGAPAALRLTADKTALKSTDGTDDTQLVVTVLDAAGKPLSNSPEVTLAIESGPGEFPTGPAITFGPQSDIAIRDGQAAIEFRSYHGGETVIRATSPGLRDATIKIVSTGAPLFVPGQTPPVQPRPYQRFEGQPTTVAATQAPITYGRENPTRSSSETPGHAAPAANDGNPATFWQSADTQPGSWWCVDLERIVAVSQTTLVFPTAENYRYKIELSEDGTTWATATDQSGAASTAKTRTDTLPKPVSGRFLRVTFTGRLAALAEANATGIPSK
jgi:hypothetical protein